MKKLLISAFAACIMFSAMSQSKSGAIKTNPIGLAIGLVNLSYETPLSETTSLQGNVAYASIDILGTKLTGLQLGAEYRIYTEAALDGFYFGPLVNYTSFTIEDDISKGKLSAIGIGAKLGWNWLLGKDDDFIIDLGLGGAYNAGSVKVDEGTEDSFNLGNYDGFGPVLTFAIGYAW